MELLSPCGSAEAFFAAVNGGADAVYLGLDDFSARKNADNFTRENLKYYLDYAHILGVKVYVALNTLVKDGELGRFFSYAAFCNEIGVDALIVQDIFLGKPLKERFPDLPLHLSTQAGVNNVDGAITAKSFGFSRVVLARETALSDIRAISKLIETEAFIQGALCTAFSGQCYLSSFAGNMSGNRGLCKQPCRKRYVLKNGSERREGYLISLSDLSVNTKISDLKSAGVSSFKIEGRMRKPSFVFAATDYYRNLLDGKNPSISPLKRTFNRGDYTFGLAFGQDKTLISDKVQSHKGEFIGKIVSLYGAYAKIAPPYPFSAGDGGKILRDGFEVGSFFCDKTGIRTSGSPKKGDSLHITTDVSLESTFSSVRRTLTVSLHARLVSGKPAEIDLSASGIAVSVKGESALERARSAPLSKERIAEIFSKNGDLPFSINASVETDGVFAPVSALNDLRRQALSALSKALISRPARRTLPEEPFPTVARKSSGALTVLDDCFDFDTGKFKINNAVLCPSDYADDRLIYRFLTKAKALGAKTYLYIPNKFSQADELAVSHLFARFDGLFVDGTFGLELALRYGKKLILGTGANVYNSVDCDFAAKACDGVCLSKELSFAQAKDLNGYYYAAGSVKVMDLLYCPFKKTCDTCDRKDISYLFDGEREFGLRRVRLNGCRFEVYNSAYLVTPIGSDAVVNLVGVATDKKSAVISALGNAAALKSLLTPFTSGHHEKPLQ